MKIEPKKRATAKSNAKKIKSETSCDSVSGSTSMTMARLNPFVGSPSVLPGVMTATLNSSHA